MELSPLGERGGHVEIVVKGRHSELPMGFREHTQDKVARLERLDHKMIRLDVEVSRERNPRQSDICERVELTCIGKGPLVRAEAAAPDPYAALDMALDKLEERLRRAADRRHSRGARTAGGSVRKLAAVDVAPLNGESAPDEDDGPLVVREKEHAAPPMSVDEALHHMELVGHDFFLFSDSSSGAASVVYKRRGYRYGLLRLAVSDG